MGDPHERGVESELAGDLDGAILHYRQALIVHGPNPQRLFDLAHALAHAGQTVGAIEGYRQVVEMDGERADAWSNLGDLLIDEGEYAAAVDALSRAVELQPDDPEFRFNLACALDAAGDVNHAAVHLDALLRRPGPIGDAYIRYARSRLM